MSRKVNREHSRPAVGHFVDENKRRGIITVADPKDDYVWVKFDDVSAAIPIFLDELELVGIEKRQQLVWKVSKPN